MEQSARSGGRPRSCGSRWVLPVVALIQSVVVLGPALGPGLVIRYDMAWSPDPQWTPFVLGVDTPAPRAVPSDAVAVLLGSLVGPGVAQATIFLAILTCLGLGAARLAAQLDERVGESSKMVALTAAVWNPYVHDRLVLGQWTILLGLAVLPWALRLCGRLHQDHRGVWPVLACIVLAGGGGVNTLAIVLIPVVSWLLVEAVRSRVRWRDLAAVVGVGAGMSAVWALPALSAGASSSLIGARVFTPAADTPLGVIGSLVSGGGVWNTAVHAPSRAVLLLALASAGLSLLGIAALVRHSVPRARLGLLVGVAVPTLVVLLATAPAATQVWTWLVTALPGGGILRDAQKLMAAWVIAVAVGLALLASRLSAFRVPATALLALAPVALSPLLAWGASGQLSPVQVPETYRQSVVALNDLPPGDVGALPWNQYRRYRWNHDRVSLTLLPRLVDRVVVYDDRLPLREGVVPGESDRARAVTAALESGTAIPAAFRDVGVRYIAVELDAMAGDDTGRVSLSDVEGDIVVETTDLVVIDIGEGRASRPDTAAVVVGWVVTGLVTSTVLVAGLLLRVRRGRL